MLVNSILVYDNELVVICNVGNKPISLTIDLIEDIESNLVTEPFTFVKRFGSPRYYYPNPLKGHTEKPSQFTFLYFEMVFIYFIIYLFAISF